MRTGKIARLPQHIREQLNHRLDDGETAATLLQWLNALPQVQSVLAAEFDGRPINEVNLHQWRTGGYRDWQVHRQALNFVQSLQDHDALGHEAFAQPCTDKLLRWLTLQYAAATQCFDGDDANPRAHWARLRQLCADITRLRRGDLYADRLALERQWLALEQTKTRDYKEKQFWAWTKRPEIRAKLRPKHKTPDTLELLKLLAGNPAETSDSNPHGPPPPPQKPAATRSRAPASCTQKPPPAFPPTCPPSPQATAEAPPALRHPEN